jgi:hypothetical protein
MTFCMTLTSLLKWQWHWCLSVSFFIMTRQCHLKHSMSCHFKCHISVILQIVRSCKHWIAVHKKITNSRIYFEYCVYIKNNFIVLGRSENNQLLQIPKNLYKKRLHSGFSMRGIDCSHCRTVKMLLLLWFKEGMSVLKRKSHDLGSGKRFMHRKFAQSISRIKLPRVKWFL